MFPHPQRSDRNVLIQMLIGVLGVLLTLQPSIAKTLTGNVTCQGRPDTDAKFQPHFVYSLEDASHPSTHAYIAANVSGLFEVSFERTPLSIDYRIVHKCDYDDGKCVFLTTGFIDSKELSKHSPSLTLELFTQTKHVKCGDL
ncbi:hypothetical protein Q1695_006924 [Nippostrongylus brasiliensis]|nr:hypothetical protein Q1695_006924 [Nippostrongylus brasiliensis]